MNSDSSLKLWKAKMGVGRMAYNQGMYRQAARHFQSALDLVDQANLPEEILSLTLVNLAKTLGSVGDFSEAETMIKRALELDRHASALDGEFTVELIEDFHQLSLLYWRAGNLTLAENSLNEAFELLKKHPAVPDELRAKLLKHKAVLCGLSGNHEQCGKMIDSAIDFILSSSELGKYSLIYADCLMVKVVLLTELGRYEEAIEIYREAIQVMGITRGDAHPKTLEFLIVLSDLAAKKGLEVSGLQSQVEHAKVQLRKQGKF